MMEGTRVEREFERLAMRVADLQAENRYLRKRVGVKGHRGQILSRAHRDALHMLDLHYAGHPISRQECRERGLSERRWHWARALLMLAKIHNGRKVTEPDPQTAVQAVRRAVSSLERQGLTRLIAHNTKYH